MTKQDTVGTYEYLMPTADELEVMDGFRAEFAELQSKIDAKLFNGRYHSLANTKTFHGSRRY